MATVKLDPAKGVQIPNMTTTERNAVSSPETGALVWNTTTSAINQYNGSAWEATDTNTQADISGKLNLSGGTLTGGLSGTTAAFSSTITSNGQAQLNNNNLIGLNTGATSEWIAKRTSSGEGIHISTTNASGADTQRLAITSNANTADFIVKASNVGIGTTSPTNKLTVDIETLGDGIDLIDGDVAHGITDYLPTNASLRLTEANATEGGARIYGATDNAGQMGLSLYGLCPDGAVATVRNVQIIGAEKSGTGIAAVANDKLVLGVYNNTTELMTINGAGDLTCESVQGGDYTTSAGTISISCGSWGNMIQLSALDAGYLYYGDAYLPGYEHGTYHASFLIQSNTVNADVTYITQGAYQHVRVNSGWIQTKEVASGGSPSHYMKVRKLAKDT